MTREIKFRAWDNITKQMCEVWDIGFKAWRDGEINYVRILVDGTVDRSEHEVELMQYTGLLDKNGAEIYEGDITFVTALNMRLEVIYRQEVCSFELQEDCGERNRYFTIDGSEMEVIGNIHQHPELLRKEQNDT